MKNQDLIFSLKLHILTFSALYDRKHRIIELKLFLRKTLHFHKKNKRFLIFSFLHFVVVFHRRWGDAVIHRREHA